VDQHVWIPFIEAFNQYDAESFNALHTEDVIRGGPWGLLIGQEYYKRNLKNSELAKSAGNQRRVALTFEHRVHREEVCYEVGYYRVISRKEDGSEHTSFGQFHVMLRKQNGIWKIAQDWDASEVKGVALTQADFDGFAANRVYE
jgi:ketosteroid isomerase-like protein